MHKYFFPLFSPSIQHLSFPMSSSCSPCLFFPDSLPRSITAFLQLFLSFCRSISFFFFVSFVLPRALSLSLVLFSSLSLSFFGMIWFIYPDITDNRGLLSFLRVVRSLFLSHCFFEVYSQESSQIARIPGVTEPGWEGLARRLLEIRKVVSCIIW